MTEPPADDNEDFSEEELEELRQLLDSEQIAELETDMLMDRVGRGEDDRTIYDDIPEDQDQLEDYLHDIHEQPDDEPIPELVSREEAARIIAEAKAKLDAGVERLRDKVEREATMAISDDAQQIASIGNDETAVQAVNASKSDVQEALNTVLQVGTVLTSAMQKLGMAAEKVAGDAAQAGALLGGANGESLQAQGQSVAEQLNNSIGHINTIDIGAVTAALENTNLEGVANQVQQLYQTIKDAATRHQR